MIRGSLLCGVRASDRSKTTTMRPGVGFVANLEPEERARYYYWWKKYLLLKYVSGIAFLLCLACLLAPLADKSLAAFAGATVRPAFFVSLISGIWWSFLECPRCGKRFRSGGQDGNYFGDDCQNCGLTSAQLSSIAKPRHSTTG